MASSRRAPRMNVVSMALAVSGLTTRFERDEVYARRVQVGLKQLECLLNRAAISRGNAKTATLVDIQLGEVEPEDVQRVVGNDELAVVADQVVGAARDRHTRGQETLFELAQPALAAAIGMRDERADTHTAHHRLLQLTLDLAVTKAEDRNVDDLAGTPDGLKNRQDTALGLDDEFHRTFWDQGRSTLPWPWAFRST